MSSGERKKADVVILGASFAGIEVLLQLRRRATKALRVVVVDRQREHGYLPLVHERLAGRTPEEGARLASAKFIDSLPETEFVEGEVAELDPSAKAVTLADGRRIEGRFLVVALGSVVTPPPELPGAEHLHTYKLGPQFQRTREALVEGLADGATPNVVVVGGGISGVELAGDLGHLAARRPAGWGAPNVTLVTSATRLVPELSAGTSRVVEKALRDQGVTVRTRARVVAARADAVVVDDGGERGEVPADVAIWAAGLRPAPVLERFDLPRTEQGWLSVGPTLQCYATALPTRPDIFACGDAVRIVGGEGTWPTMQRAIECIWQAKTVAKNILQLAGAAADYPEGPPPLSPHVLRETFFYGVSVGAKSYVVYRGLRVHVPVITPWFRRWLMRQYFARYAPVAST